jgi:methionyl-tRNA formyltransferase
MKIVFAGNGHGGEVAFKSLCLYFNNIEVLTDDSEILKKVRVSDVLINTLEESEANYIVCAGYLKIIPKEILNNKIIINTHPSLLPKYRGLHALAWSMLNLEKQVGFTIHLMNEFIDDGDILEQFTVNYISQTSREIMQLFDEYVENNLGRVVHDFINDKIIPIRQNRNEATWVSRRNVADCIIDFSRSNSYINAMFKTLVDPYPLPMIKVNGKRYEILAYKLIEINYEMHLGRVVNIENSNVYIKTKDGLLIISLLRNFETRETVFPNTILKLGKRL